MVKRSLTESENDYFEEVRITRDDGRWKTHQIKIVREMHKVRGRVNQRGVGVKQ